MAISEAETRKKLIDKAILNAGWSRISPYNDRMKFDTSAVEEFPTTSGPADYVLFSNGRPLAVVEGKRRSIGPQNVLVQAQRYSRGFEGSPFKFGDYRIPFAYSTNGEVFWFRDLRRPDSRSRETAGLHSPQGLEEMLSRDLSNSEKWLLSNPVAHPWLRPYQKEAISSVEEAIIKGKRRMMVAMATGTGKTVTTIELIHRLLKSGQAHRVLFLVDRRALAAQAVSEMAAFEAEKGLKFDRIYEVYSQSFRREDLDERVQFDPKVLPNDYLTNPKLGISFVYVCTIQRMRINLFGSADLELPDTGDVDDISDVEKLDIPIHAFDCIIADECHRGYNQIEESKWRQVLDYFDCVKIGLTATPALHTKAYFEEVVFRYEYDRAVREGYLVDYDPILINSNIRMNGVFLKEGEEVQVVDPNTGKVKTDILEDERQFDSSELERLVTVPESNRKIVKEYMKYAREQEKQTGRFPKTIVFASNDLPHKSHADELVNMLRDEVGQGDDFVQKITGSPSVDRPLQRIREFRNRKSPAIVVTVDMLTTGVDIPAAEALLFIRPVKSRILFEQMLGRGTRKCPEIHKTHFLVMDAVGVLDYFKNASAFTTEPPSRPARPVKEIIDDIYGNKDFEYNIKVLEKRLRRIEKDVSAEGRERFKRFILDGDIGRFAGSLRENIAKDRSAIMKLLKDESLQGLLDNYPKVKTDLIKATSTPDTVTSIRVIRTHDGKELKPEDYIASFERFVKENPDHIQALTILQNKPKDFNMATLEELRSKLSEVPENFTEENLRKAYDNELTDIISIIKHAVQGIPLGTTEERVTKAMAIIKSKHQFLPEQVKWLDRIQEHIVTVLLIEKDHFESIPFSRYGAWRKADADFNGHLNELLKEINVAVIQ